jgi:hypothetical protein
VPRKESTTGARFAPTGVGVPLYRIVLFNRQHQFAGVEVIDCPANDDALARAAELVTDQHGVEVWERGRIVGTLAPRERT